MERAHSLVETRLMSPSLSEAVARVAVSSGFPVYRRNGFLGHSKWLDLVHEQRFTLTHMQPPGPLCRGTPLDRRPLPQKADCSSDRHRMRGEASVVRHNQPERCSYAGMMETTYLKRYLAHTMQWMGSDGVFRIVHPGKVFWVGLG